MYKNNELLKEQLVKELQWVKYRSKILNIIEEKLFEMKRLAQYIKYNDVSENEIKDINNRINNLAIQVKSLDEESRERF